MIEKAGRNGLLKMEKLHDRPIAACGGWIRDLKHLHLQVDTPMGSLTGRPYWCHTVKEYPPCELTETDVCVILRFRLPNASREDIELITTETTLTVSGRRAHPTAPEAARFYRRERCSGKFQRTISLPGGIHIRGAQAALADGQLTVSIPKAHTARPHPSSDP
jgi:HSP20 family molecular chaperone IbpA